MTRYGAIAILVLSVFLMIRGISETWEDRTMPSSEVSRKPPSPGKNIVGDIVFNPTVSANQSEFKDGYLFNPQRALALETGLAAGEDNLAGNNVGIQTNIHQTTFSGAIITDSFKKAIITYTSVAVTKTQKNYPSVLSRRSKVPAKLQTTIKTTQLMEGNLISGYTVTSIEADKIVFTKKGEIIEKYLYDPNKERLKAAVSAKPSSVTPPRPRPKSVSAPNTATRKQTQTLVRKPSTANRAVFSRRNRINSTGPIGSPPGAPPIAPQQHE